MIALFGIEARHLARSPLLWLAFALAAALAALEMSWFLPALAGDDLLAYTSGGLLLERRGAAGRGLAGPAGPGRPGPPTWLRSPRPRPGGCSGPGWPASRWSPPACSACGFAAALAVSVGRGGRGTPDLRLLADGALAVVLGGWVGAGRGPAHRLADGGGAGRAGLGGACASSLWPAPAGAGISLSVQHLSPVLNPQDHVGRLSASSPTRSGRTWATCSGSSLLVGVLLLALASRRQRPAGAPAAPAGGRCGRAGPGRGRRRQAARPARRRAGARAGPGHLAARPGRV